MNETLPRFYPPLTLGPRERAIVEAWPTALRKVFDTHAASLEFLKGKSISESEVGAFEFVAAMATAGAGSGNKIGGSR